MKSKLLLVILLFGAMNSNSQSSKPILGLCTGMVLCRYGFELQDKFVFQLDDENEDKVEKYKGIAAMSVGTALMLVSSYHINK